MPKIIYKICIKCKVNKKKTYDFKRFKKTKNKYIYYDICNVCLIEHNDTYIISDKIIIFS